MSATSKTLGAAAVLGGACAARTMAGPGALALRGRPKNAWGRGAILAGTLAEAVVDKTEAAKPRTELPALAGRIVAGAASGANLGGARGARIGATFAFALTYPSERARAAIVEALGIPDPACALAEDAVVYSAAVAASGASDEVEAAEAEERQEELTPPEPPSALRSAAAGLAAALVGTSAMTTAQSAYYMLTGGEESEEPREVADTVLGRLFGRKIPRRKRQEANYLIHLLYGSSWGAPYGLLARLRPGPASGLALGLGVWGASLAELPAFGASPPPWEQSLSDLAIDAGFHLVYGLATSAAFEALNG